MIEPLSPDGNEITDKGYVNQHAVLERRAGLVERLYAVEAGPEIITAHTAGSQSAATRTRSKLSRRR
jgi:hypothetical protein